MVTVPALGAEWGKDELQGMTKRARREEKSDRFKVKWRAFNRGQYGIFGKKWLTRRTVVFVIFATCIAYVPFFPRAFCAPHVFWSCEPFPSLASASLLLLSSRAYLASLSTGHHLSCPQQAGLTILSLQNLAVPPPTSPSQEPYRSRLTLARTSCRSFSTT